MVKRHEGDLCSLYLTRYLQEYREDAGILHGYKGNERALKIAHNPVLAIRMLRRLADDLFNETLERCSEQDIVTTSLEKVLKENILAPSDYDVGDSVHAVLSFYLIYGINATDNLRTGKWRYDGNNVLVVNGCGNY